MDKRLFLYYLRGFFLLDKIYLDNGATSYPKAPGVGDMMKHYIDSVGCNVNRSGYSSSYSAEEVVLSTREMLCRLFNFDKSENVIFTMNITQSLNMLLKGILEPGDHCIVSSMEHNAVMRPLIQLSKTDIMFSRVPCSNKGELNPDGIYDYIKPNTKAVIMTHASNVCGTIMPVEDVGKICREKGLIFILDTAQTAGILNIDFKKANVDALAFTGHKGLLGPQGIGGFLITDELADSMDSLISGGTGSLSDSEDVPPFMPDKFEPGTPNIPGIFGLNASLKYLEKEGTAAIREKELYLTDLFLKGVKKIEGIKIAGLDGIEGRMAVVSLDFPDKDNAEIAYELEKNYGIKTRCGIHCAPSAHKTLGTFPQGTVRFSFGHFNTREDIKYTIDALNKVAKY